MVEMPLELWQTDEESLSYPLTPDKVVQVRLAGVSLHSSDVHSAQAERMVNGFVARR